MSSYTSEEKSESRADLDVFVEDLLEQMQARFADMGHSILGRLDDMGSRIDELEQSIASLLQQAGLDQSGYSNNTTVNTSTLNSLPMQTKAASLRVQNQAPQSTQKVSVTKSMSFVPVPTASASPNTNVSKRGPTCDVPQSFPITSPQNRTTTPSGARVTIEI